VTSYTHNLRIVSLGIVWDNQPDSKEKKNYTDDSQEFNHDFVLINYGREGKRWLWVIYMYCPATTSVLSCLQCSIRTAFLSIVFACIRSPWLIWVI